MEVTFSQAPPPVPPAQKTAASAAPPPGTAPASEPAKPAKPAPLSPEELKKQTSDLYDSMGWGKAPEEAPAGPGAEPEPQREPETGSTTPPPEPEPEPEPQPEPTLREAIHQTAVETAREVSRVLGDRQPQQPAAPSATAPELSAEDQDDARIIAYLERNNSAYAGLGEKHRKYCVAHYEYANKWLEQNPDKEYDPDAAEHAAWYEANMPKIDRKDLEDAKIDMKVEERFEKKVQPKLSEMKAREVFEANLPQIVGRIQSRVHALVCQVNPELGKLITGPNGEQNMTQATIDAIDAADPIAKSIIDNIVDQELDPMALELEKMNLDGLNYRFDPDSNPIHRKIAGFISRQEREMTSAPRAVQVRNGAQWVSIDDYNRMKSQILKGPGTEAEKGVKVQALNRDYWTLTTGDVQELIVDDCAKKAKARIEIEDSRARKKYVRTEKPAGETPPAAKPTASTIPTRMGSKPNSPSLGSGSDVSTSAAGGKAPAKSFGESAADVNFQ